MSGEGIWMCVHQPSIHTSRREGEKTSRKSADGRIHIFYNNKSIHHLRTRFFIIFIKVTENVKL